MMLCGIASCAFRRVQRTKNITYQPATAQGGGKQLNIFTPRRQRAPMPVLVYFYGGNWARGRKELYSYLGNRMARKDVVTVIIDYPLNPPAQYDEMALACATAVDWVRKNIQAYGGDTSRIFVAGHSAGGHLAALITLDDSYFNKLQTSNPIKGAIIIDAAGLDMYKYMTEVDYGPDSAYLSIFTSDPETWKNASPYYHMDTKMPPMLIYRGGKTFPSIYTGTERFVNKFVSNGGRVSYYTLKGKKHVGMITQFFNPYNDRYSEIISFMNSVNP